MLSRPMLKAEKHLTNVRRTYDLVIKKSQYDLGLTFVYWSTVCQATPSWGQSRKSADKNALAYSFGAISAELMYRNFEYLAGYFRLFYHVTQCCSFINVDLSTDIFRRASNTKTTQLQEVAMHSGIREACMGLIKLTVRDWWSSRWYLGWIFIPGDIQLHIAFDFCNVRIHSYYMLTDCSQ